MSQPSLMAAPFTVNTTGVGGGHGVITPGKDNLFHGLSANAMQILWRRG